MRKILPFILLISASCNDQKPKHQTGNYPSLSQNLLSHTKAQISYLTPVPSPNHLYDVHLKATGKFMSNKSWQAIMRFKDDGNKILDEKELIGVVMVNKPANDGKRDYNEFFSAGGDQIIRSHITLLRQMNPADYESMEYETKFLKRSVWGNTPTGIADHYIAIENLRNNPVPITERRNPTPAEIQAKMAKGKRLLEERYFAKAVSFSVPVPDEKYAKYMK